MTTEQEALRVADDLQSAVQTYPQMSEDEPGGYCRQEDQLMDEAAAMLRKLVAEREADRAAMRRALEVIEFLRREWIFNVQPPPFNTQAGHRYAIAALDADTAITNLRQRLEGTT